MAGDDGWMGEGFQTETDDLASFNENGTTNAQNFSNSARRGVIGVITPAVDATGGSNLTEAKYFADMHQLRLNEAAAMIVAAGEVLFALAAGAQTIEYNYVGSDAMNAAGVTDVVRTFDPNLPQLAYENGGYTGGYLTTPDGEPMYAEDPGLSRIAPRTGEGHVVPLASASGEPGEIAIAPDDENANQRNPWIQLQENKTRLGQGEAVLPPPAEPPPSTEPPFDFGG